MAGIPPQIPQTPHSPPSPIPAKAGISRLQRRSRKSPPKAANQGDSRFRGNGKYVNFRGNPPIPFLRRQESLSAKRNPPIVESIHHRKDSCLCRNGRVRRKSPPIPPIPPYKKSTPIPKLPPFPPIPIPAKAGISRLQRRSRESPPKAAKQGDSRFRGNGKYVNFRGNPPPIPFLRRQESLSAKRNLDNRRKRPFTAEIPAFAGMEEGVGNPPHRLRREIPAFVVKTVRFPPAREWKEGIRQKNNTQKPFFIALRASAPKKEVS